MTCGAEVRAAVQPRRVLLVAGEASGDLHGADLVAALRGEHPALEVFGIGGPRLREAGMRTLADAGEVATVGLTEGLGRLGLLVRAYRELVHILRTAPPDLLILIDFPEFNLRLARAAKRAGVPVFYYIAPQVWAWRRGRVRKLARRVDRLAVVLPFEVELYGPRGPRVEFVGHPLLDRVVVTRPPAETLRRHGLDPGRPTVALLPGSRPKEVEHVLPRLLAAVHRLATRDGLQFALALAGTVQPGVVERQLARSQVAVRVVEGDTYNLLNAAELALVASGTATLETALLGRPMVVVYRLSPFTYGLARLLVRGVRHIALPNIIAGREIVPELIQHQATGARIAAAARALLDSPEGRAALQVALGEVRARLGQGGAARRAAAIALEMLREA